MEVLHAALVAAGAAGASAAARPVACSAPPPWRHVRTLVPERPVPGAYGPAIDCADGDVWIGPARDRDAGIGPPSVARRQVLAGFGLPDGDAQAFRQPEGAWNAGFGRSLAAARGACVVGSPHAGCRAGGCDTGQAHLLRRDRDGSWDTEEIACPFAEPASEFGAAMATDGRTIAIGSPRADEGACDAGAVDVYELTDGGGPPRFVARLVSPSPARSARFGTAVAVDGAWIAVGEPGAGDAFPRAGTVHLACREGDAWRITESLRAPAGAVGWHGASVALAGCDLLAGAPVARPAGGSGATGSAAWWRLEGGRWGLREVIAPPEGSSGDGFGMSVALSGGWAAAGSPGRDLGAEDTGCAWAFDLANRVHWRLDPPATQEGRGFGSCVRFGDAAGAARAGPDRFLAVASMHDPERPLVPGSVEIFGLARDQPVVQSAGPQSRSASAIAAAADASVTGAGRHPDARIRDSAGSP